MSDHSRSRVRSLVMSARAESTRTGAKPSIADVLREDGLPIPGLYATGVSTASVMGRTSPGAGVNVGPSFVWGYVAARHAAHADNVA